MSLRLTNRDVELIMFLGKYKKIKAVDCRKIYKSKDYYRKRLKVLENERYIKREKRFYIKVDVEGRKLLNAFGYENYNICRNKDYQDRINDIEKIAMLSLGTDIKFTPSWELKEEKVYTNLGRKYIGELEYMGKRYIAYYISDRNTSLYSKQIVADVDKMSIYDDVIIFLENFRMLNKRNKYFMFGKDSTEIINPTEENLEIMKLLQEIDIYDVLREIYNGKEILLSNWKKADYMIENEVYIVVMPFIDTEKLHRLNVFYNSNKRIDGRIDIVTLKENRKKINEIIKEKVNIIELDNWLRI